MHRSMIGGLVVGLAVATFAGGCSSEAPTGGTQKAGEKNDAAAAPDESMPSGFSSFHPEGDAKSYFSGFDGTNDYVTTIAFFADNPPTVSFTDPSVAELQGTVLTVTKSLAPGLPAALDGKIQVMFVKSKKAGETNIHAVAGSIDQTAKLTVNAYSQGDVAIGEKRYNEGTTACNGCHQKLAVHNSSMLADLSDETILGIAVEGKSLQQVDPQTGKSKTIQPNGGSHKWQVTPAEREGLMAYLRSRSLTFQLPAGGM